MPTTPADAAAWSDIVNGVSVVVLLTLVVVAFVREWVVTGALHRRLLTEAGERERQWRELALGGTRLAERAVDAARRPAGGGDGNVA